MQPTKTKALNTQSTSVLAGQRLGKRCADVSRDMANNVPMAQRYRLLAIHGTRAKL